VSPRPGQAYYKLAAAERILHQTDAAERDIKIFETLAKDPASGPYPFQHLFETLNERVAMPAQSRAEIELTELAREVEQRPNQPRNVYLLAESFLKLGRREEARKTVARLDQLSGGDARTMLGAGVLLARYRMYPEAVQHFQSALAADPASDDAKYNLANAYFQMHDYARALEMIVKVSPEGQKDDTYLALLGDIDSHQGRTEEASRIYTKAIERNPDNDQYCLSLALTQLRAGNTRAADQELRRGLKRTPDSGKILWGLGVLSVLDGKDGQAEEFFKKSVDLMPEWQSGYSALGILYYETGQIAKARVILERFVKIFPNGGLDVNRVGQLLMSTPMGSKPAEPSALSAPARLQFLQLALALADQTS
jgi:tetratricopeptide (TPR) repeat protein